MGKTGKPGPTPGPSVRKKRARPPNKPPEDDRYSVATSNSFSELDTDDESNMFTEKRSKNSKAQPPPPIMVPSMSQAQLNLKLQGSGVLPEKIQKRLTRSGTSLYAESPEDYKKIKAQLTKMAVDYYTYTPHEDRLTKYVLYGLPNGSNIDDIRRNIAEKISVDTADIKQLTLRNPRYVDEAIYLVYFKKPLSISLNTVKIISAMQIEHQNYRVSWNFYKKGNGPTQCMNCCRYYHSWRNCSMPSRCIRCNGDHPANKCPHLNEDTKKIPEHLLKCHHCGGNHAANNINCPKRPEQQEKPKNENRFKTGEYDQSYPTYNPYRHPKAVKPHDIQTIPQLIAPQPRVRPPWNNSEEQPKIITGHKGDLFTPNQLMEIFLELTNVCLTMKSKIEQIQALGNIVTKYIINGNAP